MAGSFMDILLPLPELGFRVGCLKADSAKRRAQTGGAIEESRLLRAESRQHARELRALREERAALLDRG
jgi:hypothetical protein